VVGGVGVGIAAAATGPALAQDQRTRPGSTTDPISTTGRNSSEPAMDDPRSKYPKPPFRKQPQPWPGLARDMDPKPDHGETGYRGSGRLAGRKALITGGDSGIGRAAAIAYAREGADVAINYFPSEAFCRNLVTEAAQKLGGLDIVVCNAGRQQSRPSILDVTTEDFDATMKTNIYAPFWIIKTALAHLKPGSCIIATTSEQAYDPSPDLYDYAQTKAATMNYVKSLAKQLGPKGIRVNGVAPGPVWTPLQISGGAPEQRYENFGSATVFGRPGQPAELASIYVQLAAEDASFATGNIYGAGGGQGQP
jgi:NAD(P)-dependent dehydrogenase (short-subunit alcohol dehydrogenase family)